jgi:hypothetical protein
MPRSLASTPILPVLRCQLLRAEEVSRTDDKRSYAGVGGASEPMLHLRTNLPFARHRILRRVFPKQWKGVRAVVVDRPGQQDPSPSRTGRLDRAVEHRQYPDVPAALSQRRGHRASDSAGGSENQSGFAAVMDRSCFVTGKQDAVGAGKIKLVESVD